jgi:exonuclease SbcD
VALKIMLTSDVHLGMKFAGYPEVQGKLCEARFQALERIVEIAGEEECDLLAVAGDLFHRNNPAKGDILKATKILSEFEGPLVAVLPGNHDFIAAGSDLWHRFRENAGDNVLVLTNKMVYPLGHYDLDAALYPVPCESKHSRVNYLDWVEEHPKDEDVTFHIGMAHGSLEGFSPDFDGTFFPMSERELLKCGVDLWLMGHTHIQYPVKPGSRDKIFYPATPEPDGFDCSHEGKAWILEIDEDKAIRATSVSTGRYRFLREELEVENERDLEKVTKTYAVPDREKTLLRLKLHGRLRRELYEDLPEIRRTIGEHVLLLRWDDEELVEEITGEIIDSEFTEGSFPHQLLTKLADEDDYEALQRAYAMINEVRQ